MRFFLDTFIGDGTTDNEFRPAHADGWWTIIDLRPDSSQQAGLCLVGADVLTGSPSLDLGDESLDERINPNRVRAFGDRLGVTLTQRELRAAIAEILLVHGSFTDAGRWNPITATNDGRHEIWLGGRKIYDAPQIVGLTYTESFDTADSDTLGPDLSWTEITGDMDIVSNTCRIATIAGATTIVSRADSNLASNNNYTQISLVTLDNPATGAGNGGPVCRMSSSAADGYFFKRRKLSGSTADYRLIKLVAAAETGLTSFATQALSLPETLKVEANGTTIKGYIGGVEKASVTDSGLATGVRGGLAGYKATAAANVDFDSFETGDLGAAAQALTSAGTFTKAPTFPTGVVTPGAVALTGTVFQKAPTFPTGVVTGGAVALTGTVYQLAPTFPTGAITGVYALTGTVYQQAPTFPTGTITAGTVTLTGIVYQLAPTFFVGTITGGVTQPRSKEPSISAGSREPALVSGYREVEFK